MLRSKTPFFAIVVFIMFLVFLGISYLINAFNARSVLMIGASVYLLFKINIFINKNKFDI